MNIRLRTVARSPPL
uniref:Uncharacterized protein n=1 Tax=Arundo donax TaxID=35708 RepID=A0A0A9BF37_ARUDO